LVAGHRGEGKREEKRKRKKGRGPQAFCNLIRFHHRLQGSRGKWEGEEKEEILSKRERKEYGIGEIEYQIIVTSPLCHRHADRGELANKGKEEKKKNATGGKRVE